MPTVWIDQEKLDKVVFNVLSNAFKYTLEGGKITIEIGKDGGDLKIRIADSGEGRAAGIDIQSVLSNTYKEQPQ